MSVRHLALVADVTGLPPTCKLVLYALSIVASDTSECNVSNFRLQELTGLSERAVRSTLRKLEQLRFIKPSVEARFIMASWNWPRGDASL